MQRRIDPTEHAEVLSQRDAYQAQGEALARSLSKLVHQLERIGGYSTPEQQAELREARALLVECER